MCLVAPKHVDISQTRDWTCLWTGSQILYHFWSFHQGSSPTVLLWNPVNCLSIFFVHVSILCLFSYRVIYLCSLSFIYSHEYFSVDIPSLLTNWLTDWIALKMLSCSYNGFWTTKILQKCSKVVLKIPSSKNCCKLYKQSKSSKQIQSWISTLGFSKWVCFFYQHICLNTSNVTAPICFYMSISLHIHCLYSFLF